MSSNYVATFRVRINSEVKRWSERHRQYCGRYRRRNDKWTEGELDDVAWLPIFDAELLFNSSEAKKLVAGRFARLEIFLQLDCLCTGKFDGSELLALIRGATTLWLSTSVLARHYRLVNVRDAAILSNRRK